MSRSARIGLVGAGKHALAMLDILLAEHDPSEIAMYDDDLSQLGKEYYGVKVRGTIDVSSMPELVHVAIGDNHVRKTLSEKIEASGRRLLNVIGPLGYRARSTVIGDGIAAYPGAKFLTESRIGKGLLIGDSTIDRLCVVGDYVRISHGVFMAPKVEIGEGAVLGVGAVLMDGVKVGPWATIGAGALVTRDVPAGHLVAHAPAVVLPPSQPVFERGALREELGKFLADQQGIPFDYDHQDLVGIGIIDSYTILLMVHFIEPKLGITVDMEKIDYGIFKSLDRFIEAMLELVPKNRGLNNDRLTFL